MQWQQPMIQIIAPRKPLLPLPYQPHINIGETRPFMTTAPMISGNCIAQATTLGDQPQTSFASSHILGLFPTPATPPMVAGNLSSVLVDPINLGGILTTPYPSPMNPHAMAENSTIRQPTLPIQHTSNANPVTLSTQLAPLHLPASSEIMGNSAPMAIMAAPNTLSSSNTRLPQVLPRHDRKLTEH